LRFSSGVTAMSMLRGFNRKTHAPTNFMMQ
jgi:hypothetical protein